MIVQRAQHQIAEGSGGEAERQPAARFAQQEQGHAADAGAAGVRCGRLLVHRRQAQQGEEDHHPEAVVEQRFADHLGLQAARRPGAAHHPQHRDRIGGRDQRPEQQAVQEAERQAKDRQQQKRRRPHQRGARQQRHGGERGDRQAPVQEIVQVDVQRAGEQQESEQHVEHQMAQIHLPEQPLQRAQDAALGAAGGAEDQQRQRGDQGQAHHADRLRQAQQAVIEVAEQRGQRDEQRRQLEVSHAAAGFRAARGGARAAPPRPRAPVGYGLCG